MGKCNNCYHNQICDFACKRCDGANCIFFVDSSRMVELPCKVGDTMYVWSATLPTQRLDMEDSEIPAVFPAIVVSIRKNTKSVWIKLRIYSRWLEQQYDEECGLYEDGVDKWKYFTFPASAIGKTVFLTREEAEAELARRTANE